MKTAIAHLASVSPYSQSRFVQTPKLDKEAHDDYEKRTWRDRCHTTPDGRIFIPPMAFKKALAEAAGFSPKKIKGRGSSTYAKHFKAGVLVTDGLVLLNKKEDVEGEWFFMHAQPSLGDRSPRVLRCYPVIREWAGAVRFFVLDDTITEPIFHETLIEAGNFIGIGRFRPKCGGFYGRFKVESVDWS